MRWRFLRIWIGVAERESESVLTLLYGLVAFGQIRMRRIDGHEDAAGLLKTLEEVAA